MYNVLLYNVYVGWLGSWVVSVLDWGAEGPGFAATTLSGNSLRQTVHTHCASVHQAAKLVAALLRLARVTVGLAESNGGLPPGLWLTPPTGWLPRTGISSGTLRSVIEYGLPLPFYSRPRDISNNRPHPCTPCMRCGLINCSSTATLFLAALSKEGTSEDDK